jgi:hypothetical protein
MSIIPLELQRKLEQRWAARSGRAVQPASKRHQLESKSLLAAPSKAKRETRMTKAVSLRTAPAV